MSAPLTTTTTTPATAAATPSAPLLVRFRELGILGALVVLVAVTALVTPRFLSAQSIRDVLLGTAIVAVVATGQAVVVITRNIDLSVGSVLGLTAFATGTLLQNHPGIPVVVTLLFGVVFGGVCGLVNGALVRFGGIPALVVTLGMLYVFRGFTYFWAGGKQVNADKLPGGFLDFGSATVLGVPFLALIAVGVIVVAGVVMRSYRPGRELYALGSDPVAARLAGIRTGPLTIAAFVISGALAGLGGVLYMARFGTVDASAGTGYELTVVAAVVVGGVAVFGGSGTVYGAALGALLLATINSALPALTIDQFWQQAVVGALILLAIGADRVVAGRAAAALRRRSSHVV